MLLPTININVNVSHKGIMLFDFQSVFL